MTKKSGQKFKYLKKYKAFFITFKGLSVVRNGLKSKSACTQVLDVNFARSAVASSWVPFFSSSLKSVNSNLKFFNFGRIIAQIALPTFKIDYAPNLLVLNL